MKYFKRSYGQVIQRFNKDWSAVDWYYFEVDETNYAEKQIQKTYEGKVFKHDTNNLDDEFGGLAEGELEISEYEAITKEEFYNLWNKNFTNTYLVQQLKFNNHWKFSWYNIDYNKTEQELYDSNLILCGTYADIFLLEIEYGEYNNFLSYSISEGKANLKYGTVDNWDELVSCVQIWIDYIEKNTELMYSKPENEKLERIVKVKKNGVVNDALFSTYRNLDKNIEKFRGAYLQIENQEYELKNTFISFEDLLIDLQEILQENIKLQTCFSCKFSHYLVAGNDNFGDLNCFVHAKNQNNILKNKYDVMDLFDAEYKNSKKIEETHYCKEFTAIQKNDFVYKSIIKN